MQDVSAAETDTDTASRGRWVLPALFLVAMSLRPQIVGIGPLVPEIRADLGVSFSWTGALTTIPVLCMGLFAPLAPLAVRRIGAGRGVTIAVLGIAVTGVVRALAPTPSLLLVTTIGVGIGVAVAGTLLPVVVKQRFADRPMTATGLYVAGIQLGAASSGFLAVPLAAATTGWRGSLVVMSIATVLAVVLWSLQPEVDTTGVDTAATVKRPWHVPRIGSLVALFALQSIPFYGLIAWMPAHLVESGWTEARAGTAVALLNLVGLGASLSVPRIADRVGSRRGYLLAAAAAGAVAISGLIAAPGLGFAWAAAAGVGLPVLFAVTLTLPLDVSSSPREAAGASAVVLGVGYTTTSLAPTLLGALRDWTGDFRLPLVLLLVSLAALATIATTLRPERLRPTP